MVRGADARVQDRRLPTTRREGGRAAPLRETSDGCRDNIVGFIVAGAAHLVRTSSQFNGGITGALRVAHLAESFHMRAEVHGGGLPILHLCCAIPNTTYYESFVDPNPVEVESGIGRDGAISPPQSAGIGWEVAGSQP